MLMGAAVGFEQVVLPLSQKLLIDSAIAQGECAASWPSFWWAYLVLFVVQGRATLTKDYLSARTGAQVMSGLRARLFDSAAVALHAVSFPLRRGRPDDALLVGHGECQRALTQGIQSLVESTLGIVVGLCVMFALEWKLSLASMVTWVVFVLGPGLIGPRAARASYARQEDIGHVSAAVQENLSVRPWSRSLASSARRGDRFRKHLAGSSSRARRASGFSRRSSG